MECLLARCGGLGHAGTFSARKIVASPTSYSRASSAIVSPAAYLSAILRFWPASRALGRPNFLPCSRAFWVPASVRDWIRKCRVVCPVLRAPGCSTTEQTVAGGNAEDRRPLKATPARNRRGPERQVRPQRLVPRGGRDRRCFVEGESAGPRRLSLGGGQATARRCNSEHRHGFRARQRPPAFDLGGAIVPAVEGGRVAASPTRQANGRPGRDVPWPCRIRQGAPTILAQKSN
jgi:hypothetical protein